MSKDQFWERAFLASLGAGRSPEQARVQAEQATSIWWEQVGKANQGAVNPDAKPLLAQRDVPATPKRRGRPPKDKTAERAPEPEPETPVVAGDDTPDDPM